MAQSPWQVYLSGEIHTDWRDRIIQGAQVKNLNVNFFAPVTDHEASDLCGVKILGDEAQAFWRDRKSAGINAIRTHKYLSQADLVVVCFGPKYKQWNAAFDAGFATALGKPLIILHNEELDHALKEIDTAANATARTPEQVIDILEYILCQS